MQKNKQNNNADLLVKDGFIVCMDNDRTILKKGSIVVKDGKIQEIADSEKLNKKYIPRKIIDATNKLLMPGLVNTHTHSSMTVFRGYSDDMPLHEWLTKYLFPAESKYMNKEVVRAGAELAIIEMLRSGTTTFNDMYYYQDETVKAAKEIGMRAIISESLMDLPAPNSPTPQEGIKYIHKLMGKYKNDPLIRIGVAVHSPYTCAPELLVEAKKLADQYNAPYHIHVSETQWEMDLIREKYQLTPVQYLDSLGVLDDKMIAAHCVHLTDEDIQILKKRKVGVAHNPESNMKLSSGVARIPELVKNNVAVGIGTDGVASNNNLDMFEEVHSAALLHKLAWGDPTAAKAKTMLKLATISGAKVLGMEEEIGSIEVGKKADIILLDLNNTHLIPLYNAYSQLVYSARGSDVTDVIIDGKIVMENNKILTIDENLVKEKVRKLGDVIFTNEKENLRY